MANLLFVGNWLYRSFEHNEVLNVSKDYFRLRKPIDQRIYEIARKHCGNQIECKISLDILHKKTGTTMVLKEFRQSIASLSTADVQPDYQVSYDKESDLVIFNNRDLNTYHKAYLERI